MGNVDTLEDAIAALGKYYSVNGKNDFFAYIIENALRGTDVSSAEAITFGGLGDTDPSGKIAELLINLADGGYYIWDILNSPVLEGFEKDSDPYNQLVAKMSKVCKIITSDNTVAAFSEKTITAAFIDPTGQPASEEGGASNSRRTFITTFLPSSDAADYEDELVSELALTTVELGIALKPTRFRPALSAIQVYPAYLSLAERDSGAVSLFLNAVPTLEWSRCVPYVSIDILTPQPAGDATGALGGTSLLRFLMGSVQVDEGTANHTIANSMGEAAAATLASAVTSGDQPQMINQAGMEVFTSPQTLIPSDERYVEYGNVAPATTYDHNGTMIPIPGSPGSSRVAPVIDRMRPFMTLTKVDIEIKGNRGAMSTKRGTISLTLHDRSRLGEIAIFVKPDMFGTTELLIEYGWQHPDSNITANAWGPFLNSLRVKENFTVYNSSYSFTEDGQVEISLQIVNKGATATNWTDIATDLKTRDLMSSMNDLFESVRLIRQKIGTDGFKDVAGSATIANLSPTNVGSAFEGETADEINNFIKRFSADPPVDADYNSLALTLKKLKKMVSTASATLAAVMDYKLKVCENGCDPFFFIKSNDGLEDRWGLAQSDFYLERSKIYPPGHSQSSRKGYDAGAFSSFGKLMMLFVGQPMVASGKFEEVQLLFYALNDRAGWMAGKNIGAFPIPMKNAGKLNFPAALEEERKKYAGQVPIGRFVNWVTSTFINSQASPAWGLSFVYELDDEGKLTTVKNRTEIYDYENRIDWNVAVDYTEVENPEGIIANAENWLSENQAQVHRPDQTKVVTSVIEASGGDTSEAAVQAAIDALAAREAAVASAEEGGAGDTAAAPSSYQAAVKIETLIQRLCQVIKSASGTKGGWQVAGVGALDDIDRDTLVLQYSDHKGDFVDVQEESITLYEEVLADDGYGGRRAVKYAELDDIVTYSSARNQSLNMPGQGAAQQVVATGVRQLKGSVRGMGWSVNTGWAGVDFSRVAEALRGRGVPGINWWGFIADQVENDGPWRARFLQDIDHLPSMGQVQTHKMRVYVYAAGHEAQSFEYDSVVLVNPAQSSRGYVNTALFSSERLRESGAISGRGRREAYVMLDLYRDFGPGGDRVSSAEVGNAAPATTAQEAWNHIVLLSGRKVEMRASAPKARRTALTHNVANQPDYLKNEKQNSLARAYYNENYKSGLDVSFKMPRIRMIIETVPHHKVPDQTILRLHFVDEAAMKYSSLGKILQQGRNSEMGVISAEYLKAASEENPDPAQYNSLIAGTMKRLLDETGILQHVVVDDDAPGAVDGGQPVQRSYYTIKGGPPAIKHFVKGTMPSITFGTQNSAVIKANAKTMNNSKDATIHMMRAMRADQGDGELPGELDRGLAMRMMPFSLNMEVFGCPLIHHTQQFFVDFGTNTTVDNIFAVNGLKHSISPGSFVTSFAMIPITDAYGTYHSLADNVNKALANIAAAGTPDGVTEEPLAEVPDAVNVSGGVTSGD